MSRNLCRTTCYYCDGAVLFVESPRPCTPVDCGLYYDEYEGMLVAHAVCEDCEAQYLAWVDERPRVRQSGWPAQFTEDGGHFDLSFRSTFNDEPGKRDLPRWEIETVATRKRLRPWRS